MSHSFDHVLLTVLPISKLRTKIRGTGSKPYHGFVDKTKHVKKQLAANSESMADKITYSFERIIKDPNLVVVSGDKKSCIVIINKISYQNKLHEMISDGTQKGIYKDKEDKTLDDLNNFKSFL